MYRRQNSSRVLARDFMGLTKTSKMEKFRNSLFSRLLVGNPQEFLSFSLSFLDITPASYNNLGGRVPPPRPFLWEGKSVGGVENFFIKPVSAVDRGGAGKSTHLLKKSNLPLSPPAPPAHLLSQLKGSSWVNLFLKKLRYMHMQQSNKKDFPPLF